MATMAENRAWQLEDFVDSLVVDLDKTRETLAVKAINKPLSYTVKEVALDLNIFPSYDGDQVNFVTAQPGQEGASKVTIQLDSITDQQVRATTKAPSVSEVSIDEIDVSPETKKTLRKLGVNSVEDLKQIEEKKVDLKKVSDNEIDYSKLANQIKKARRNQNPPNITGVNLSIDEERTPSIVIEGEHLAVDPLFRPVAVLNERLAEVMSHSDSEIRIRLDDEHELAESNEVILTFDPYAVVRLKVRAER
jgi:hypothetical protein